MIRVNSNTSMWMFVLVVFHFATMVHAKTIGLSITVNVMPTIYTESSNMDNHFYLQAYADNSSSLEDQSYTYGDCATTAENDTIANEILTDVTKEYLEQSLPEYNMTLDEFYTYEVCPNGHLYKCTFGDTCIQYCSKMTIDIPDDAVDPYAIRELSIKTIRSELQVDMVDKYRNYIYDKQIVCSGDPKFLMISVHVSQLFTTHIASTKSGGTITDPNGKVVEPEKSSNPNSVGAEKTNNK